MPKSAEIAITDMRGILVERKIPIVHILHRNIPLRTIKGMALTMKGAKSFNLRESNASMMEENRLLFSFFTLTSSMVVA
jgi:hypothetical protein